MTLLPVKFILKVEKHSLRIFWDSRPKEFSEYFRLGRPWGKSFGLGRQWIKGGFLEDLQI